VILRYSNAVKNGVLQYFSPSSLELAMRCPLKWWFRYVAGIKEPQSAAADLGKTLHRRMARYLETGVDVLERVERVLLPFCPAPGADLLVEHWVDSVPMTTVMIAGLPMKGCIDLAYDHGTYINDEREVLTLPAGTAVVKDWKFTRDPEKYQRDPRCVQLYLYAAWAHLVGYERICAQLAYAATRGRPHALQRTAIIGAVEAAGKLREYEETVENMKRWAACTRPDEVPATGVSNGECDAYGGCPNRKSGACVHGQTTALVQIFGGDPMSVVSRLKEAGIVKDGTSNLEIREVCERIKSAGKGFPALAGEAARAYARAHNLDVPPPESGFAGSGPAAGMTLRFVGHFFSLATDLGVGVVSPLPPDVPPPSPPARGEMVVLSETGVTTIEEPFLAEETEPQQPGASAGEKSPSKPEGMVSGAALKPSGLESPIAMKVRDETAIAQAIATLKASACKKTPRIEAAEVLERALAAPHPAALAGVDKMASAMEAQATSTEDWDKLDRWLRAHGQAITAEAIRMGAHLQERA
jgi:hypothetical protein